MDSGRRNFLILSGIGAPAGLSVAGQHAVAGTRNAQAVASLGFPVTEAGAVGDGRADDTAAIVAAVAAHDRVYFPAGRYRITRSIPFRSNQLLLGESKGGLAGRTKILVDGAFAGFRGATAGQAATYHPVFCNLTVENAAGPGTPIRAGSIGIDLDDTSYAVIEKCAFRYHERAVSVSGTLAGYYHSLFDNEYASSTHGIFLGGGGGGNSNRIIGGRIFSCRTGIHAQSCNENFVSLAIENCELGIHLGGQTQGFDVSCRFEGCGDPVAGGPVLSSAQGAAVLIDRGGFNHHIRGTFSNASDRIIDLDGRNFVEAAKVGYSGVHQLSVSNLFWNEALSADSDGDGLADGLQLSAPLGSQSGWALSVGGSQGQKGGQLISIAGSAVRRDIRVETFATTPGQPYIFAVRCRASAGSVWNLRGSAEGYAGTELTNFPLSLAGEWAILSVPFLAAGRSAHFYFTPVGRGPMTAGSGLELDAIWFGPGSIAPVFGLGTERQRLPTFPDNASAKRANLAEGHQYKTATGEVRVVV